MLIVACPACLLAAGPSKVDFNRDIRPILSKNCFVCHGPDAEQRQGGLRLDQREAAVQRLDTGNTALVPGEPSVSELHRRITAKDDDLRMPPPGSGRELSGEQIERLRLWIEQGAPYAEHWSFVKPTRPPRPKTSNPAWAANEIDHFVLAELDKAGLKPSPAADPYQLIRRLSLDLRGLPPTWEEIEAYEHSALRDPHSALSTLIDRFLADTGYGERWARVWLDLGRYADSRGYGSDPLRPHIWRWRDWVIEAFNRNLSFDQFTIQQIAGDLLPDATVETRIATAFHRNTMTNTEGGTDDEEFRTAAVKDRVDTTLQVWMGLTMGCAKCHNHKYDPVTQEQYYQTYALFNQTADADRGDESPNLEAPTAEMVEMARQLDPQIAELKKRLAEAVLNDAEQRAWEEPLRDAKAEGRKQVPKDILPILDKTAEERSDAERQKLVAHFRTVAPSLKPLRDELAVLEGKRPKFPQVPVMQELPADKRRATHVLVKGNFLQKGKPVEPALPTAFHPMPEGAPRDRLGLARWLVDRNNPLTARVMVNRFWAQLFGRGLVETEEDFGTQGMYPSHPELLDWLAVDFMDSGWDVKRLLKLMVTSAAYRQTSQVTPDRLARDPQNRLFSRGPRFRLEAEMVRDQALALSGLLSRKVGGPSVYPPQPPGMWQAAFNGERTWNTSTGGDRYRRGLYTFWRRTVPYPSMATFDAPSRETCSIRRVRTNTPLQALVTMNDPVYVEAAQSLARRIVREGGSNPEEQARYALRLCLCRPPSDAQVRQVVALYQSEEQHYRQDEKSALQLATDPLGPLPAGQTAPQLAAWTVVANVLLNMDAVLTKG
jgi:hypothetical protein